jgi:uncharacterized membrane-anchored protein YhcB (DUF1043 family)
MMLLVAIGVGIGLGLSMLPFLIQRDRATVKQLRKELFFVKASLASERSSIEWHAKRGHDLYKSLYDAHDALRGAKEELRRLSEQLEAERLNK